MQQAPNTQHRAPYMEFIIKTHDYYYYCFYYYYR